MGSYTKIEGEYRLDKAITAGELKEIALECKAYDGIFKDAKTGYALYTIPARRRKITSDTETFSELASQDTWKNFWTDQTVDFAKQLLAAFQKRGVQIKGKLLCRHETGDCWKVLFDAKEITLWEAVRTYKLTKTLKPKEIKTTVVSSQWA